jgi:hypothetical protein
MRNASFGGFGEPSNMDNQQAETFEEYSIENRGGQPEGCFVQVYVRILGIKAILNVLGGLDVACSTLQDLPSKKLKVAFFYASKAAIRNVPAGLDFA